MQTAVTPFILPNVARRTAPHAQPKTARASDDAFLLSLIEEIEAQGLGRPCVSRDEILAAIESGDDTNFLIKTNDLANIVLANLTEQGIESPEASCDEVMSLIKSESACFAQEYLLVNTEVFEDAMFGVIMEEAYNSERVSMEEVFEVLRQ